MAQTKVTSELLRQFAKLLQEECGRFCQIKNSMDETLNSFLWNDPVAHKFKTQYEDGLKPLNDKLYPAMEQYQNYLIEEVRLVGDVNDDRSNLGTFVAGGAAATGATIGAVGMKRGVINRPSNTSSPSKQANSNPQMSNGAADKNTTATNVQAGDEVKNEYNRPFEKGDECKFVDENGKIRNGEFDPEIKDYRTGSGDFSRTRVNQCVDGEDMGRPVEVGKDGKVSFTYTNKQLNGEEKVITVEQRKVVPRNYQNSTLKK